ncbi:Lrp/AsnC family transcriptional regulator [Acidiferrimicrobium sp. IK]|uniref:Lrp/AsnC family transcriptional regulator n=1 Tax=Acidiferrimicrobium sp. IK TaxID=2871700 RepID=UPI0021CB6516|nr:Lrp/AsnC family transcriptional regulator [Acidiferrimicrobium sp. IK]MCU4183633.1 Lrp/AsnC family transcriptional regulator [Acidiferrimicrobium sp. IK]
MPLLDDTDRQLVTLLLGDGRMSYQELARAVHLSPNSTADRVRRLQTSGVISGVHASLDLARLGRHLLALTDLKLKDSVDRLDFERDLAGVIPVLSAVHTTGEYDYQLTVATTGTADLEIVVDDLRRLGAREIQSRIVLGRVHLDPARLLGAPG